MRLEAAAVKVAAGADVMAERREERTAKAKRRKAVTLGEALDLYRNDRLVHLRSGKHAEQVIRLVFGGLMDKALPDLARSDSPARWRRSAARRPPRPRRPGGTRSRSSGGSPRPNGGRTSSPA